MTLILQIQYLNPYSAEYSNLIFHPLEVVARYLDPQLQVGENAHICLLETRHLPIMMFKHTLC